MRGEEKKKKGNTNSTTAIPSKILQTCLLPPKNEASFGIHTPLKGGRFRTDGTAARAR